MSVAIAMSCAAPVDISLVNNFSAIRPPQQMTSSSRKWLFVRPRTSRSGSDIVTPSARPRGMIVTLWRGSAFFARSWSIACPASCQAVISRSFCE